MIKKRLQQSTETFYGFKLAKKYTKHKSVYRC